jgi:hypothetical protein
LVKASPNPFMGGKPEEKHYRELSICKILKFNNKGLKGSPEGHKGILNDITITEDGIKRQF